MDLAISILTSLAVTVCQECREACSCVIEEKVDIRVGTLYVDVYNMWRSEEYQRVI
jgi:hypothetical protein